MHPVIIMLLKILSIAYYLFCYYIDNYPAEYISHLSCFLRVSSKVTLEETYFSSKVGITSQQLRQNQ